MLPLASQPSDVQENLLECANRGKGPEPTKVIEPFFCHSFILKSSLENFSRFFNPLKMVLRAIVCTSYDRFLFLPRQFLLEVKINKKSTIGQVLHDLQRAKRVLNHVERVQ